MLIVGKITYYIELIKRQTIRIIGDLFFFAFFRIYLAAFLFLNTILWFVAFYIKHIVDEPRIALHYNVDFGVDYYGSVNNLFILPTLGLVVYFFNMMLFSIVRNQQDRKFIGHILGILAVLVNIILLAGLSSIYLINTK
jgi:hypothetical protein